MIERWASLFAGIAAGRKAGSGKAGRQGGRRERRQAAGGEVSLLFRRADGTQRYEIVVYDCMPLR